MKRGATQPGREGKQWEYVDSPESRRDNITRDRRPHLVCFMKRRPLPPQHLWKGSLVTLCRVEPTANINQIFVVAKTTRILMALQVFSRKEPIGLKKMATFSTLSGVLLGFYEPLVKLKWNWCKVSVVLSQIWSMQAKKIIFTCGASP